jgi:hypothetical protein
MLKKSNIKYLVINGVSLRVIKIVSCLSLLSEIWLLERLADNNLWVGLYPWVDKERRQDKGTWRLPSYVDGSETTPHAATPELTIYN